MLFLKTDFITGLKVKVINTMINKTDKKTSQPSQNNQVCLTQKNTKDDSKRGKTNVQNAVLKKTRLFLPKIS